MCKKFVIALVLMGVSSSVQALTLDEVKEINSKFDSDQKNILRLAQDINDEKYYLETGVSYLHSNQYQKAIEFINIAISLNPQNPYSYYCRGYVYNQINQYQKAIKDFTIAISLNSQEGVYYAQRGYAYNQVNQYQKAIEDFTIAISFSPQEPIYYKQRGISYGNLVQPQKAKIDFTKASKLFKEKGDIENYNLAKESLKLAEKHLAFLASEKASKKRTRELLIKRACLLGKRDYTDGEILNEIYRLVQMNTSSEYQPVTSSSGSIASEVTGIFGRMFNSLNEEAMENEARSIFATAKKKCKF